MVDAALTRTKVYFVTDVHGSERCFRKFVNAGKFYGVSVLVLGGDITGKMIVPFVKQTDGTTMCDYGGEEITLRSTEETDKMVKKVKDSGYYPFSTDPKEMEELKSSRPLVDELFERLMKESVHSWVKLADERLKGTGIRCYISPGNDDTFAIDEALDSGEYVINPEEKVVELDNEHEMITMGHTNHTPWKSPREVDEAVLTEKIDKMAGQVKNMNRTVFNLHVPPIDTTIDQAPLLDATLKPVVSGGQILMTSAGSTAVRASIEKYQPLCGIHGHIHESRGVAKIGRTLCFNPGSEYNSGILRGLLCELDGDRVKSYVLTSG
jgi:Icc-related predicted phosphoesterase